MFEREEINTRKFRCTKCGYVHVFSPKGKSKFPKRVKGFSCPNCGYKPTEAELAKKRGRGPKPKEERRKRVKNEVPKEAPRAAAPQPYVEQFKWKTRGPPSPGELRSGGKDYAGWQLRGAKASQPTDRSLGEAVLVGSGIRPSGPVPRSRSVRSRPKMEEWNEKVESLGPIVEKLEEQGRKLAGIMVTMSGTERRVDEKVAGMDAKIEDLGSKLQALSALLSRMEDILSHYERRER